jgi:hypothetical protein
MFQDRVQHLLLWVVELLDPTEGAFCVNNGAGHEGTALYSIKRMAYLMSRNGIMNDYDALKIKRNHR